ncbi:MAG TPA: hypothetical protein VFX50_15740, partial [Gemmatimonadales bacterium]|nr:hypothetical protein [Gemmatimonadales bacterium]
MARVVDMAGVVWERAPLAAGTVQVDVSGKVALAVDVEAGVAVAVKTASSGAAAEATRLVDVLSRGERLDDLLASAATADGAALLLARFDTTGSAEVGGAGDAFAELVRSTTHALPRELTAEAYDAAPGKRAVHLVGTGAAKVVRFGLTPSDRLVMWVGGSAPKPEVRGDLLLRYERAGDAAAALSRAAPAAPGAALVITAPPPLARNDAPGPIASGHAPPAAPTPAAARPATAPSPAPAAPLSELAEEGRVLLAGV